MTRQPVETVEIDKKEFSCDGGTGPLGHPRVYLNMGKSDHIDCPYCGCRYVLSKKAKAAS